MSAYLESSYAAIRAAAIAVWPDVASNGVWEEENIEMVPWDRLNIPLATIILGDATLSEEWSGIQGQAYTLPAELWYTATVEGDSHVIRAKLEAMRDYLIQDNITFGQVLDIPDISWSERLSPNELFISKNYTQRSGRVSFTLLAGEVVTVS
jgi:hypothetical protein